MSLAFCFQESKTDCQKCRIQLTALGAVVLNATVLGEKGQIDNLALVQLTGSGGNGDGVVVGTLA